MIGYCDNIMREKDGRCGKRGMQVTAARQGVFAGVTLVRQRQSFSRMHGSHSNLLIVWFASFSESASFGSINCWTTARWHLPTHVVFRSIPYQLCPSNGITVCGALPLL